MAGVGAGGASFKIPKWGPRKLREIFAIIESALNQVNPTAGIGIEVERSPGGSQINLGTETPTDDAADKADKNGAGGTSGSPRDYYGAYNGAPATLHLLESSPPDPL